MQAAVLVVGAGPVGLTAAANLAHCGVPVRIIDSRAAPTQLSKALVIWRRSLLTLDPLIPFQQWMQKGARPVAGVNFADSGAVFASVETDGSATTVSASQSHSNGTARQHMMPAGLMVTQAQIEAGLEQLLQEKYSISVQRSTQLSSFSVDEASGRVRCRLSSKQPNSTDQQQQQQQQEEEEVLASYLIGCDGARSTVRKGLGVAFNGYTDPEQRFLMVDCSYEVQPGINSHAPSSKVEEAPQLDRVLANASSAGLLLVIPLVDVPNGIRVVWATGGDGPAQPTLDDFQSQLMQQTRLQIKLKDPLWQSEFNINERQVDNYVHCGGRVLLAGDAAHVHSPAGGQGMNTGIQDAANLAWKVALAAECDAPSRFQLLQTYQEERHPVGADAVRFSGMVLRANTTRNPLLRLMRRLGLTMLAGLAPARQRIIATVAEDTVSYTSSSLAKPASTAGGPAAAAGCAGTAFPDASISIDGVVRPATDLLRGGRGFFGSLVLMTPPVGAAQGDGSQGRQGDDGAAAGSGSSSKACAWPTHWGHWPLHVASLARKGSGVVGGDGVGADGGADGGGGGGAVDSWGLVSAAVGGADGVLVRPDGIIAAAGGPDDIAAWMRVHGFAAEE